MSTLPADIAMPSTREEAWRYTPVDDIVARLREATAPPTDVPAGVDRATVDALAGAHGGPRLVVVNGRVAAALSDLSHLPAGLWLGSRRDAPVSDVPPPSAARDDGFQALNRAGADDAAVVLVDTGADIGVPIHVVHLAAPGDGVTVSQPRTVVVAGPESRAAVIETFCGTGGEVVTNASTTIRAGRDARVHHTRVQAEDLASVHVGHTRIDLDEAADVRTVSVMLGADIARHAVDVTLLGPRARAEIDGLAVPSGRRRHDHVVTVDHAASAGTSRQRVRAVVDDHARSSFSGHVIVRAGTTATDADQSSRNLLLTPTAEADARPWLEILADDVRCTHGAAVGRLDDDALFYLRSRGIPLAESRQILIGAFVRDVLDTIPHASLREDLTSRVAFA